jgi:hypothetical protein
MAVLLYVLMQRIKLYFLVRALTMNRRCIFHNFELLLLVLPTRVATTTYAISIIEPYPSKVLEFGSPGYDIRLA